MCVLMVLGFLVAWTPYASFTGWIFMNKGAAFHPLTAALCAFFAKSSALYNPLIYVLMNKQVSSFENDLYFCLFKLNIMPCTRLAFASTLFCSLFQFRNCMLRTIGMGGAVDDETSVSASKTEVSSVS